LPSFPTSQIIGFCGGATPKTVPPFCGMLADKYRRINLSKDRNGVFGWFFNNFDVRIAKSFAVSPCQSLPPVELKCPLSLGRAPAESEATRKMMNGC
jgi:hypothetical protein